MSDGDDGKKRSGGYATPPEHSKFQKGQSGNPNGRPKGSLNSKTLKAMYADILLERSVDYRQEGQQQKISKLEAIFRSFTQLALKGDRRAMQAVLTIADNLASSLDPAENAQVESREEDVAILRRYNLATDPKASSTGSDEEAGDDQK